MLEMQIGQPAWTDDLGDKPKHGNIVYFYDVPKQDGKASKDAGRPIFRNKTFIHISTPGDANVVIERPLRERDVEDFPREWHRYQQKQAQVVEGTPLEEWPKMNRLQVAELKALNIHTVEQLASLSEANSTKLMGFHELKKNAMAFLQVAKEGADLEKRTAENAELKARLAEKDEQIGALEGKMAALERLVAERLVSTDQPRRKAGRPRKDRGTDPAATGSPSQ